MLIRKRREGLFLLSAQVSSRTGEHSSLPGFDGHGAAALVSQSVGGGQGHHTGYDREARRVSEWHCIAFSVGLEDWQKKTTLQPEFVDVFFGSSLDV